jgi:plasmid maintenance system antidote protein VapI
MEFLDDLEIQQWMNFQVEISLQNAYHETKWMQSLQWQKQMAKMNTDDGENNEMPY